MLQWCKTCLTLMAAELMNAQPSDTIKAVFPSHCVVNGSCKIKANGLLAQEGGRRRKRGGGEEAKEEEGGLSCGQVVGRVAWIWRVNGKRVSLGFLGLKV